MNRMCFSIGGHWFAAGLLILFLSSPLVADDVDPRNDDAAPDRTPILSVDCEECVDTH